MTTRSSYITAVDCLDGPSDWPQATEYDFALDLDLRQGFCTRCGCADDEGSQPCERRSGRERRAGSDEDRRAGRPPSWYEGEPFNRRAGTDRRKAQTEGGDADSQTKRTVRTGPDVTLGEPAPGQPESRTETSAPERVGSPTRRLFAAGRSPAGTDAWTLYERCREAHEAVHRSTSDPGALVEARDELVAAEKALRDAIDPEVYEDE